MLDLKTSNERLLELAKALHSVPRSHFDMSSIFDPGSRLLNERGDDAFWKFSQNWYEGFLDLDEFLHTCGTTACVAGYARMVFKGERWDDAREFINQERGDSTWVRAAAVLGLNKSEALALFSDDAPHQTPRTAATAIRRFVRLREKSGTRLAVSQLASLGLCGTRE